MRDSIGGTSTRYLLTDHLGSSDTVLDPSGNVIVRESFAAFGARRGSDWSATTPPDWAGIANTSRHGFTGHEHLDNLLLIHMNGRVYDPGTGRFLSVDPLMGDLTDSQQVNAYAYVGNRPLRFTDPSGLSAADEQDSSDINYSFNVNIDVSMHGVGRWFHRVGSGMAHFLGFGPGEPPPPADVMNRQSAESGLKMCGPGQSSSACDGTIVRARGLDSSSGTRPPGEVKSVDDWFPAAATIAVVEPTPIGEAALAALGVVLVGAEVYRSTEKTFITYTMVNITTGQIYSGRASGFGTPQEILDARFAGHHMRAIGFSDPALDKAAQGPLGYGAIRGREQQLIDFHGGIGSPAVGNAIRGVSRWNPAGVGFHDLSDTYFGPLAPYTGAY